MAPLAPCTGIFLGPSKSGKTVAHLQGANKPWLGTHLDNLALISMILEQYRGVFEKIFSPSINIDNGWIPVKKYIEQDLAGGEHGARAGLLGRVGRGGAAAHHPARSPRRPRSWR